VCLARTSRSAAQRESTLEPWPSFATAI
jgi:hypothetical protein